MATAAALINVMSERARREIEDHFAELGAFDPDRAILFDPPSQLHQTQFDYLLGRSIIRETADHRYWFDRYQQRAQQRRQAAALKKITILVIIVGALVAGAVVLFGR